MPSWLLALVAAKKAGNYFPARLHKENSQHYNCQHDIVRCSEAYASSLCLREYPLSFCQYFHISSPTARNAIGYKDEPVPPL